MSQIWIRLISRSLLFMKWEYLLSIVTYYGKSRNVNKLRLCLMLLGSVLSPWRQAMFKWLSILTSPVGIILKVWLCWKINKLIRIWVLWMWQKCWYIIFERMKRGHPWIISSIASNGFMKHKNANNIRSHTVIKHWRYRSRLLGNVRMLT